jgi:PIN domain nuclease of toxin-antitoxin system
MSSFLLDTHTFIWLTENNPRLPDRLRDMIDDADLVYLSIASLWEIAIKLKLGKLSGSVLDVLLLMGKSAGIEQTIIE